MGPLLALVGEGLWGWIFCIPLTHVDLPWLFTAAVLSPRSLAAWAHWAWLGAQGSLPLW